VASVSKRQIAVGHGFEENPIVCDGTPHPNTYPFWAEPSGPLFKKGDATANIAVFLCGPDTCQSGSSGIQVVRLR
jgi:hypothetical protein